jgi:hypothetical protein
MKMGDNIKVGVKEIRIGVMGLWTGFDAAQDCVYALEVCYW